MFSQEYILNSWKTEEAEEKDNFKLLTKEELLLNVKELSKEHPSLLNRSLKRLSDKGHKFSIKVMQWNILAQALCLTKDSFIKCPNDALVWETRRLKILEEILTYNPDILCLQEVDHFGYLKPALESVGYKGYFFPKPDSPALYTTHSNGPDGCALFYNDSKLALVNHDFVILETPEGFETNQVAINAIFRSLNSEDTSGPFCVSTTHLKAKNGWEKLRQQQGHYLLKYLKKYAGDIPLIICGDFNAECSEGVYDVMAYSDLNMDSAYKKLSDKDEEPPYTTWKIRGNAKSTSEVCRTIDYIWYSKDKIQIHSLLDLPTPDDIGLGRLPSFRYPSDHLSLFTDLSICG